MRVRRLAGIAAVIFGFPGLAASSACAQEVTLRAVTAFAEGTQFSKNFERFIEKVNADAKGVVRINYIGGPRAMPPFEVGNAVRTKVVDIANVTGDPFTTVVSRWALANYVTDQAGAPPELQYNSWRLHAVYSSLHTQRPNTFTNFYPLAPTISAGRVVNLSATLRAGSGIYHRATQPPGDPGFTLNFTASNGGPINPATLPRLNVIRLQ